MTTKTVDKYELVLRHWERFLSRGCRFQDFTKDLYDYLYQRFGFIAHYNRSQFWEVRFNSPEELESTIRSILDSPEYALGYHEDDRENSRHMRYMLQTYATVLVHQAEDRQLALLKTRRAAMDQEIQRLETRP
jgi:hypothetical protein